MLYFRLIYIEKSSSRGSLSQSQGINITDGFRFQHFGKRDDIGYPAIEVESNNKDEHEVKIDTTKYLGQPIYYPAKR